MVVALSQLFAGMATIAKDQCNQAFAGTSIKLLIISAGRYKEFLEKVKTVIMML